MDTLNKFCPSLILRKRTTPGEPEGFAPVTPKKPQQDKEPIDDAALASILGSLLWLSLRTRPDISWAVSRLASLAATEPDETRSRLKQLMSYLRWTLDFAMVFSGSQEQASLDVYTDASWSDRREITFWSLHLQSRKPSGLEFQEAVPDCFVVS
eukprot:6475491-Amphidinium_carterae.2